MMPWPTSISAWRIAGWLMARKRLLILANSFKRDARCIAGRELSIVDGRYRIGRWIRPVSAHDEGQLELLESTYQQGSLVQVLDIAEVDLAGPANDPYQPENWTIAGPHCWRRVPPARNTVPLEKLVESPPHLWPDDSEPRSDRIWHERLRRRPPAQSIYVIRPLRLRLVFCWRYNKHRKCDGRKSRAMFDYNGVEYDLPLTDPEATHRHGAAFPALGEPPRVVELASADGPLVCVSLGNDFEGFHYKIAAAVIGA
jgi:hypothetical protein